MNRYKIGLIMAIVGTATEFLGILLAAVTQLNFFENLAAVGWILALVAYLFCGLKTALGFIVKGAKWCFMLGLLGGIVAVAIVFAATATLILYLPLIPIFVEYRKHEILC